MKKKSFMDSAKGFLSTWKKDYSEKNKDILDRKQKREEEAEAMKQEMIKTYDEIKTDLEGKSKDIAEAVTREFAGFSDALKRGTADIQDKLQLEKRLEQLKFFLKDAENVGAQKFEKLADSVKQKLSEFDSDLVSEKVTDDKTDVYSDIKDEAETNLDEEKNIDDLQNDVNKLFDDIDQKTKD